MDTQIVQKVTLNDGCLYSGEAIVVSNKYIPHGWGKKLLQNTNSATGVFENGVSNGLTYYNRHNDMYLGYMDKHTETMNGWGIRMAMGVLYFGVWKDSNMIIDFSEQVQWMMFKLVRENYQNTFINIYPKLNEILFGIPGKEFENSARLYSGFHFMTNGEIYVGTCLEGGIKKTGDFIKYNKNGTITIGEFEDGILIKNMDIQRILDMYLGVDFSASQSGRDMMSIYGFENIMGDKGFDADPLTIERRKFHELKIDTDKKYF